MIIDYDSWIEYEGFAEGSGRNEKVWLTNPGTQEIGLFKFRKSSLTSEHISEKLASDIAHLLGLECANIEIGRYHSRVGCMSYLINQPGEELIEGISLISKYYPNYNSDTMHDDVQAEYYSFDMIMQALENYGLKPEFLKIMIFDCLIGNSDRHQNNWAIIKSKGAVRLSPMYDNGSSLCSYIEETNVESYLGKDYNRFIALVDSRSKSIIRIDKRAKKLPSHLCILQYLKRMFYSEIRDLVNSIVTLMTDEEIDRLLSAFSDELISDQKKQLIKLFLLKKVELIDSTFL
jgi:hypothetical protein